MYFETSDLKIHFLMIRNSEIPIKYAYTYSLLLWSTSIVRRVTSHKPRDQQASLLVLCMVGRHHSNHRDVE